ncbi:multiheme c-type cytochrome [Draconibacterium mangrovi]|uniref:multiheme c-type cytochrome n=1 Tax=Draconibacterium mangrovi TaxID=2697469 RepID=UPI0013D19FA6|nr:multiheme c-type cytochrome [Draconibacterium mangrovi]
MKVKKVIIVVSILFTGIIGMSISYSQWNSASPSRTCASCHEISPSVGLWQTSAHRDLHCSECHGTALSNGIHSIKEKSNMLFTHWSDDKSHDDIQMNEQQVIELSQRCAKCHMSEYAKWQSGGHSVNYAEIFMNEEHNRLETPYWDCLRCHGMFYDGTIKSLVQEPIDKDDVWKLINEDQATVSTIPCLSCHQVHTHNEVLGRASNLDNPKEISYEREERNTMISWYVRTDKGHIRADRLMTIDMFNNKQPVQVAGDPASKLCIQCHSPNFKHQTGSEDDRTPTGVHEGLSCIACHAPHSNASRNSCDNCHPAISNCNLDVKEMNTSYKNRNSSNDIHSVSCTDCHSEEFLAHN